MRQNWIGVASAEHVARGIAGGFMQLCHGKRQPLLKLSPGDRVSYYSPTQSFGGKNRLQAFTAFGTVAEAEPYLYEMGGGFIPHRRDVKWQETAQSAAIAPLLAQLSFTASKRNWGYAFRFGLLKISDDDMALIAQAMGVT